MEYFQKPDLPRRLKVVFVLVVAIVSKMYLHVGAGCAKALWMLYVSRTKGIQSQHTVSNMNM